MAAGEHPDDALAATLPSSDLGDTEKMGEGSLPAHGPALVRGAHVGHFTVLEPLGAGGMGVVVAAYDPGLDRKVALKLLRGQVWAGAHTDGRQRLLREAQAMARLQHPNVVTVYEVGTVDGEVFVAMELVGGETLASWVGTRTWREVLAAYLDAGRGLAAAHRAGITHRDFKPENVLVGRDGSIRVGDFGLASAEPVTRRSGMFDVVAAGEPDPDASPSMTRAGTLVGTPAYMSPEQHKGEHADARSDQFSFCVAAWEGLHGQRPFAGDGYRAYADAVIAGRVREPPAGTSVPARLRRVLRRGLQPDPAQRFPSMDALLAELGHDPAVARRRWAAGGVAAVLSGLALWGFVRGGGGDEEIRCSGGEDKLAGVWDDRVRTGIERAFAASGRIYAADTYDRVRRLVDDRAAAMTSMRREACEATHVRGEQSAELLDRRIGCLDERLAETRALTELFAGTPEPAVVDKAVEAAMTLPAVDQCADAEALLAAVPPPPDQATRTAVAGLRERVAAAEALGKAGRYQQMYDLAVAAGREAVPLGYPPLLAEAHTREAEALGRLGKFAEAEKIWLQVVDAAARAHDDRLLAKAWSQLIFVRGYHGKRFAEAAVLEPVAAAAVLRAGNPPEEAGYMESTISAARMAAGKYAEAEAGYAKLVAMWERFYGPEHIHVATALTNLGHAQSQNGHTEQALVSVQRAVAIREKLFGPEHPAVAISIGTRGAILSDLGRDQEAMVDFRRTLAIREKVLGPDHPLVATSRLNLGMKLRLLGRHDEALVQLESSLALSRKLGNQGGIASALLALGQLHHKALRESEALASVAEALAIQEAQLGPDHPEVADTLKVHANILRALKRYDEAERGLKRALHILETTMGADNTWLSGSLQDLGLLAMKRERWEEAAGYYARAIAIGEKAYSKGNPGTLRLYMQLARARAKQGREADVNALIDRAAADLPAKVSGSMEISWVAWDVGLALWGRNHRDDRARGRALVERCLAELRAAKASAKDIAETEAWLADHPLPPSK